MYRHNTWEPEENVLDSRLIEAFEQSQRNANLKTPNKRGPKPKLKVKAPAAVSCCKTCIILCRSVTNMYTCVSAFIERTCSRS